MQLHSMSMLGEPLDRGLGAGLPMGLGLGPGMGQKTSHPQSHGPEYGPIGSGRMGPYGMRGGVAGGAQANSPLGLGIGMGRADHAFEGGEDDDDSRNTEHTSTESNQEIYQYSDYNFGSSFAQLPYELGISDPGYADHVTSGMSKQHWSVLQTGAAQPPPENFEIGCSKFYVSNLPVDIRLEELEDLFGKFGFLSDVLIKSQRKNPKTIADRPYAIISYRRPADAQIAMQKMQGYTHRNVTLNIALQRPAHPRSTNSERLPNSSSATKLLYGPLKRASSCEGFANRPPPIEINDRFLESSPRITYADSPMSRSDWSSHHNAPDSLFSDHSSSSYSQQQWDIRNKQTRSEEHLESEQYNPFTVQQPLNIHAGHWLPQLHRSPYDCVEHGPEIPSVVLELDRQAGLSLPHQEARESRQSPSSVSGLNTANGTPADRESRPASKNQVFSESSSMLSSSLFAFDSAVPSVDQNRQQGSLSLETESSVQGAGRTSKRPPVRSLNRYRTAKFVKDVSDWSLDSNMEQAQCKIKSDDAPLNDSYLLATSHLDPAPALQHEDLLVALMVGASAGALAAISAVHGLGYRRYTS